MINTFSQSPPMYPTQQGSPLSIVKLTLWIFAVCVLGQIIGTCVFGVYFHTKLDKIEDIMAINNDYLFLRRIQKCLKKEKVDPTLLSCKKVIDEFRSLISEITQYDQPSESHEKLTAERENSVPEPRIEEEPRTSKKVPVAAIHVVGDKNNSSDEGLWWRKRSYFSMQNEITSTNNKLKIETPGVYYIYSQVSYCANLAKPQTAPFVQSIHLKRSSEPEKILLKGVNTVVSPREDCALHSTQIGAVFTFKENDLLFVKVTDPACVNYSPEYTYFGTFKVGDTS
ncbi:CD40 ligand [Lithobates pipiens]